MSKFNAVIHLNVYEDANASNNPTRNYVKWAREILGANADKPKSEEMILAPGESRSIFNGSRTLSQDNTTEYSLSLKAGTSNTYVLTHTGGTSPGFRAARVTGADNTTQITVVKNGSICTFSSTGGTALNLIVGGAVIGDEVVISGPFNSVNEIRAKIIGLTATSFSIENASGVNEGPITLAGAGDILIFSSAGIQAGDVLRIFGGFSLVSQGSYDITSVGPNYVEFYSSKALPSEADIVTQSIAAYFNSKSFMYLEADGKTSLTINGVSVGQIDSLKTPDRKTPAMFMQTSTMWSVSVTNDTIDSVRVFFITIE